MYQMNSQTFYEYSHIKFGVKLQKKKCILSSYLSLHKDNYLCSIYFVLVICNWQKCSLMQEVQELRSITYVYDNSAYSRICVKVHIG